VESIADKTNFTARVFDKPTLIDPSKKVMNNFKLELIFLSSEL